MTKVLAVLGAWRLVRALARIVAVMTIAGLVLGYVSSTWHRRPAPVVSLRHVVAPIERQLQSTFEDVFKR
jgi:hypothetical protein